MSTMNFISANEEDVSALLRKNGISDDVVDKLADNFIDGESLLSLISDIEEFEHLVPQSGLRIKIKKIVQKATTAEPSTPLVVLSRSPSVIPRESYIGKCHEGSSLLSESACTPTSNVSPKSLVSTPNSLKRPLLNDNESDKTTPKRRPIKIEESTNTNLRLPIPCPLPSVFPPAVEKALLENHLTGSLKFKMLRECTSFFYGLCPSPEPFEYLAMSQALCDKYPILRDVAAADGRYWVSVKHYLTQRFRNTRRMPQPTSSTQLQSTCNITAVIMPKTLSMKVSSSDDTENKRNEESVIIEYKKRNSNNVVLKKLLKLTHESRRVDIITCCVRLTDILDKYPFFMKKIWVINEFELIVGTEKVQKMRQNWEKYQIPILRACSSPTLSSDNPLYSLKLLDQQFRTGPTAKQNGAFQIYKSSTDINSVVLENTYSEPRLVLFASDSENKIISQGFIVAEKNVIFEITDFTILEGLVSLLASYYVFHVNYPKSVPAQSLLLFLQECLFELLEPSAKKSARYRATVNSINKALKDINKEESEEAAYLSEEETLTEEKSLERS